ncbi:hypothetical protein AUR04nite_35050 [Glutamicibacter uratoxydans]|uniref:Uncharacterized protein n=1 Tax=Glutamicibacter uratoxydans TaxID=43667 RepID=A0A4Y4DTH2_GLUUR|nr:hypothetical protein AUR04nite_35050 [Glutamicibacter uratoxydans]
MPEIDAQYFRVCSTMDEYLPYMFRCQHLGSRNKLGFCLIGLGNYYLRQPHSNSQLHGRQDSRHCTKHSVQTKLRQIYGSGRREQLTVCSQCGDENRQIKS